jgi:hypothetical protein
MGATAARSDPAEPVAFPVAPSCRQLAVSTNPATSIERARGFIFKVLASSTVLTSGRRIRSYLAMIGTHGYIRSHA